MLIKDPYLESNHKKHAFRTESQSFSIPHSSNPPPLHHATLPNSFDSTKGKAAEELRHKVQTYEEDMRRMTRALSQQQHFTKKILNYQMTTNEYHEAMKNRNYELNTKLNDVAHQAKLLNKRYEEDQLRFTYDKDLLMTKYEQQSQEVIGLKRNINLLLDQKTRLEEEIEHLKFLLEKEVNGAGLELREVMIRMENMERTYRGVISTKDEEIGQLHNRIRIYEDENKRLNDFNRTLQLTKLERLDNLSQINHVDSNIKSNNKQNDGAENYIKIKETMSHQKERQKQQKQRNQLVEQRRQNDKLRHQMEQLQKKYERQMKKHGNQQSSKGQDPYFNKYNQINENQQNLFQASKSQGLINSIVTLRNGITKQIFQLFFKSIREGQRSKTNSLVIFIQNWKALELERIEPYIKSYLQARDTLKRMALDSKAHGSSLYPSIQSSIPLHVSSRPGRSQLNTWLLSTLQFTKNQRDASKKSLNNNLLFLFRLLTIEYRIRYPMQGKSYVVDADVRNQLGHQIVKGIKAIVEGGNV